MKTFDELVNLVGEERAILIAWETLPEEFIKNASIERLWKIYHIDRLYNAHTGLCNKILETITNEKTAREMADLANQLPHHVGSESTLFVDLMEKILHYKHEPRQGKPSLSDWDYIYRLSKSSAWATSLPNLRDFSRIVLIFITESANEEIDPEVLLHLLSQPGGSMALSQIYIYRIRNLLKNPIATMPQ